MREAGRERAPVQGDGEGFKIMTYRCKQGGHSESIWNSRNGVTPFMVGCRQCPGIMEHVEWHNDIYAPDFKPPAGMRIFVILTIERALEKRRRYVERHWDHPEYPMSERWKTKEAAIEELAKGDIESFAPCTPDVVEVAG